MACSGHATAQIPQSIQRLVRSANVNVVAMSSELVDIEKASAPVGQ
jgi:hypothetical protein